MPSKVMMDGKQDAIPRHLGFRHRQDSGKIDLASFDSSSGGHFRLPAASRQRHSSPIRSLRAVNGNAPCLFAVARQEESTFFARHLAYFWISFVPIVRHSDA
jgi:hypothetical protein